MTRHYRSIAACFVAMLVLATLPAVVGPARAEPTASGALIELIHPGSVVGDGRTAIQLGFLALGADGTPLEIIRPKVVTSAGQVGKVKRDGTGRYSFELVPPVITADKDLQLVLTGRTTAKVPVTRTFHLLLQAPLPSGLTLEASPPMVTLGPGATSTLSIQIEPAGDVPPDTLRLQAMVGSIANVTHLGDGRVTALYTAPPVKYPHLDIISVVDARDPGRLRAQLILPLSGRADFPVSASPGAAVLLTVGEREFGPVVADAHGHAQLPLEVPPGLTTATVTTPRGSSEIELGTPSYAQAAFLPAHAGAPGLPDLTVPLRLVVATPGGAPDAEARPVVQASAGAVGEAVYEGSGVYRFDFRPPAVTQPTTVELLATLPGSSESHRPQMSMQVVPAVPDRLDLQFAAEQGDTGPQEARLHAVTSAGHGLPGQTLAFGAVGATVQGGVSDLGDGLYAARVLPSGAPLELWADPVCTPTGNPVHELVLLSSTDRLAFESWTSTILTVIALDELGHPVSGVPLSMSLVTGDGSLPAYATTAGCGVARVGYTAGPTPGLAVLRASYSGLEAAASILQGPAGLLATVDMRPSGSEHQLELRETWGRRFPVLRSADVPQAAVVAVPASSPVATPAPEPAPPPASASVEPVAAIEVLPKPATVAPGDRLTLLVTATGASGAGVTDLDLDLLVSAGNPGEFVEVGDGLYRVVLQVPKRQEEPLKITVSTADGEQFRFVRVPVVVSAAEAGAPDATPAPEPVAQPEPAAVAQGEPSADPTPRERKPRDGAHRWLRLRGTTGTGVYNYDYVVSADPRTLLADGDPLPYERSLVLDGMDRELLSGGDASALVLPEVDLRGRFWVPALAYVGADLRYRGHYLGVDTDSFARYNEGIDLAYWDNFLTVTLLGRYYHDLGETRLWAGLAAGTVTTAIPVPAHWSPDGGDRALWFFPWGFTSFYGGVRGGVETGFGLELLAEASFGTERWTGVFVQEQSYELGYEVFDHVTVNLVVDLMARHILVPLEDIEPYEPMVQVYDTRLGLNLGFGVAF